MTTLQNEQGTKPQPMVITPDDIKVYEVRTHQMLMASNEQRDTAQFQVLQLRGEVAAITQRLENARALIESMKESAAADQSTIQALNAQIVAMKPADSGTSK